MSTDCVQDKSIVLRLDVLNLRAHEDISCKEAKDIYSFVKLALSQDAADYR